jgi:alpha-mannosidase
VPHPGLEIEFIRQWISEIAAGAVRAELPVTWELSSEPRSRLRCDSFARDFAQVSGGPLEKLGADGDQILFGTAVARVGWLCATVEVPEDVAGRTWNLQLDTNAEGLAFIDGAATLGIDENHSRVRLDGGHSVSVDVLLHSRRDETPKTFRGRLHAVDLEAEAYAQRLACLLDVALCHPAESSQQRILVDALLTSVSRYRSGSIREGARVLLDDIDRLRAELPPEAPDIFLLGTSHMDVTWLWTLDETRFKMARTTATALRYLDESDTFRFSQSQPILYRMLRDDFPDLYERLRSRVGERWELLGPCFVEPDCSVSSGESLVRQILYGQAFWEKEFGRRSSLMWLPDTFGYCASLPQILIRSGISSFVTTKMTWNDTNRFPYSHFDWIGIDGSRIRCTFPQYLGGRVLPRDIHQYDHARPDRDGVRPLLYAYGFGDGGGGPVPEDLAMADLLRDMPGFSKCRPVHAEDAVREIGAASSEGTRSESIPEWAGELYLELHRGTFTTHGRAKRYNRKLELALRDAELWSSIAARLAGQTYPEQRLRLAWETLLLHQFHDIVTGTSIPEVYESVYPAYERALADVRSIAEDAVTSVMSSTEYAEFSACNAHAFEVTEWVEVDLPDLLDDGSPDHGVAQVEAQIVGGEPHEKRIGFEATVPALATSSIGPPERDPDHGEAPSAREGILENQYYRLEFSADATIKRLFDRRQDRQWMAGPGNELQAFVDRPRQWEAWDLAEDFERDRLDLFRLALMEPEEDGPVRATMRIVFETAAGSRIDQRIRVYRSIPRIDFDTAVQWKEPRVLLKAAFPVAIVSDYASFDIQFGRIRRPTHRNTSWERARFEVCAHKWMDLSDASGGVSVLNDCKYGCDVHGSTMRLTLLRNPAHADPRQPTPPFSAPDHLKRDTFTDTGFHRFTYSLLPHAGAVGEETVRQALSLNSPPRVVRGRASPSSGNFGVSDPLIVLEALKQAEDGRGLILRLVENGGGPRTARVRLPFPVRSVEPVDLMEQPAGDALQVSGDGAFDVALAAFEIGSFRLL